MGAVLILIHFDDDYGRSATGGRAVGSLCSPYGCSKKLSSEQNSSFCLFTSFTAIVSSGF